MKFSIAVPSLDQGRYLSACLDSVAAQRDADFEVLIADGGSTDGSLEIIADRMRSDARLRLVSTGDHGHADAINRALARASGDVLAFLNADDIYLSPDVLSTVAAAFDAHPGAALVSGGGIYIDEQGQEMRRVRLRYHPLDGQHLMKYRTALLQPATFWRRNVMARVTLPADAEYSFDSWFFYDAWKSGFRILEIDDLLAGYRLHGENKSLRISPQRIGELARLEDHKFGSGSLRGRYLRLLQRLVAGLERASGRPGSARRLKRAVYIAVNSLSFAPRSRHRVCLQPVRHQGPDGAALRHDGVPT
jgi:glycosyltransferase involved in cell wall biosynthesis